MAINFNEARTSRSSTIRPASETRIYTCTGSNDEQTVRNFAIAATPAVVAHPYGTLYRHDIKCSAQGYAYWQIEVPYGPRQKGPGQYSISFDTTGGTVHITNSRETVNRYTAAGAAKAAPDMGGAIGVRGDQIDGTDIVIPALKLSVEYTHPQGLITLAQIKNLARWTGKTNSTPFLTFLPGEVLFLGCSGSEGTDVETRVAYQFAMSENTSGQSIGDVLNVAKEGWQHAWISYEDAAVNGAPAKRPRWVYIEKVYDAIDLAVALGFGA